MSDTQPLDNPKDEVLTAPAEASIADAEAVRTSDAGGLDEAQSSGLERKDASQEVDVLPRGNPLRMRSIAWIAAGAVPAFLLMAKSSQHWWGVPAGLVFVAIAAWGIMDLVGAFDDGEERVVTRTELTSITGTLGIAVLSFLAFCGSIAVAQASLGPWWLGSVTVTGTFLGLVAAVFKLGQRLGPWQVDELGLDRPLLERHGFWVLAIGALLYFPAMGLQSLWDPWETHYGEVAREILARDDWVSLWWAQDGWFWSKPILNFWIQALAMASLGTHYRADEMLTGAGGSWTAHPEWVVRTPNVLMTLVAMYLLYKGVAKVFGRRAGLLGAIVLATVPDWFFLAHQTMTDMPFVAAMTGAMGLLLNGLNTPEEEPVRLHELNAFGRRWRLSLWHLIFGVVLLCALPQILYLISRNVELVLGGDGPKGFRFHWDEFKSGSAANCGLPGNQACAAQVPATIPKIAGANPVGLWKSLVRYFGGFEPSLQGLVWSGVLGILLYVNWGERRARRLLYIGAWFCAAIATMGKGPAGFALPMICAFAYVATKRRWTEILRLEILSGVLVILAVAIPWYLAMYMRHGSQFTDRLIFHDMVNRAFSHVHDTNEGDDTGIRFYIWQLGYALFPWTGLAPLGLLWGFRRSDSALARVWSQFHGVFDGKAGDAKSDAETQSGSAVGDASVLLVMWFVFAFALFTFMGTKFHHYIFPAVPPVAMLIGVVLDDILGTKPLVKNGQGLLYAGGLLLSTALLAWGASHMWPGSVFGNAPEVGATGSTSIAIVSIVIGLTLTALVAFALQAPTDEDMRPLTVATDTTPYRGGAKHEGELTSETRRRSHEQLMIAGAVVLAAAVIVLVGRDLVIKPEGADQPGAIRLLQLFTYNYKRAWPDSLDFRAALGGFTVVAAILVAGASIGKLRRHAVAAFCALSFVWALWGVDVYMVKTSPHWGQREVIQAYYKDRKGPAEPLVAYQMNWKGENFYTSNRIPAFVSSGAPFQTWLKEQKEKGVKVMYFVTEHSRLGGLRSEVGAKSYKELTDKSVCNKFVAVRAEF